MDKSIKIGFMSKDLFSDFEPENYSDENYNKIDLHKNVVDKIILVSKSGNKMYRETDLIDVWFDSGSMPYAQWHYPFENKDLIDKNKFYPADFIAEGVDQTRGWFYTLHAISSLVFNSNAYKNVISNGLVLDKNGQKMSKRLGNAVDPFKTLENYGADATRWYMISNSNPWDNLKFDIDGVDEVRRKFLGTLYNTYSFFSLYANIDGFSYNENDIDHSDRPEIDRWILSELNSLIAKTDDYYNDYEPTKAARAISKFVIEYLSNWYVRLSRRRFWKGDYELDKISAYQTLFTVLLNISKISAPIAPFFMEKLYQDLTKNIAFNNQTSVHLDSFPKANSSLIDLKLEDKINYAQRISSLTLSLRAKKKIKVRQPLNKIMVPVNNNEQKSQIEAVSELIKREVNVKNIEFIEGHSDLLIKEVKPNFKTLGPRFGPEMKEIATVVKNLTSEQIQELETRSKIDLIINKKNVTFDITDFEILSNDIEGWLVAHEGSITVALDITINDDLIDEGISREIVSRVQTIRKESGFEVTDRIKILILQDEKVSRAINNNIDYIKSETLANFIELKNNLDKGIEVEFDKIKTKIFLIKE